MRLSVLFLHLLVLAAAVLASLLAGPLGLLSSLPAQLVSVFPPGHRLNPHRVTVEQFSYSYSSATAPVLEVASGAVVEITAQESSSGQVTAASTAEDIPKFDSARLNPVHGPVYVAGAEPGDVLQVEVLSIVTSATGWTAVFPGFGANAAEGEHQIRGPALLQSRIPRFGRWLRFAGVWVPLERHVGSMGVAPPAERGPLGTIPPDGAWTAGPGPPHRFD